MPGVSDDADRAADTLGRSAARESDAVLPRPIPVRHPLRWVSALLVALVLFGLAMAFATNRNIEWPSVAAYLVDGYIIDGVRVTILLTLIAMVIGTVLGTLVAVARLSDNFVLARSAQLFIWFFRGTPQLVQLIFWFNIAFLFPTIGFGEYSWSTNQLVTPIVAASLGLGLNEAAYMSEIVRAGILSVPRGQTDASMALGMTPSQTFRRIVLPQALRIMIPPTGNQLIAMLKVTSLVSVIAAEELFTRVTRIYSANFQVIDLLIVASVWYLILTTVASFGQHYLERRLGRGYTYDNLGTKEHG